MDGPISNYDKNEYNCADFIHAIFSSYELINKKLAYIVWNHERHVIYSSERTESFIQIPPKNLLNDEWRVSMSLDQVTYLTNFMNTTFNETQISSVYTEGHLKYSLVHLKTPSSIYYICQIEDVSNQTEMNLSIKDLQEKLVEMDRLVIMNEFTASLVHEIRNPLTSIKGFIQLVQSGVEQNDEYFRVIIEEIEKIENISRELLSMSNPTTYNKTKVQLKKIINDTSLMFKLKEAYKDIELDIDIDDDIKIDCHELQIRQVFINLIKNASEAMDFKGRIKITSGKTDDKICVKVIDYGHGIPNSQLNIILKAFYTTKPSGTGLGLVISHHILKNHNGHLKVYSKEGEGTTFKVIFPSI